MIAIFCALGAELEPLRRHLTNQRKISHDSFRAWQGQIGNAEVTLIVTGVGLRKARRAASAALDEFADLRVAILSGVAGALRDDLPVGRVIVGERLVLRQDDSFDSAMTLEVDRRWLDRVSAALSSALIPLTPGAMMTSRRPLVSGADKRAAHSATGAISVDMESAVIADEMNRRDVPFVCIRTILDKAGQDLPAARLMDPEGNVRPLMAAKALIRNPATIVGVARLLRDLRYSTRSMAAALQAVLTSLE